MNVNSRKPKASYFFILIIILLITALIFVSFKYVYYVDGNENGNLISGTYYIKDKNDSLYMAIDYDDYENSFCFFKNNKKNASGKIEKNNKNYYELYNNGKLYGKVIPSYKLLYFIDKNLNVFKMTYFSDEIIAPAYE